jgi:hypothetical protein
MKGTDIRKAVYNLTKDRLWSDEANDTTVNDLVVDWMKLALDEFPPEAFTAAVYPVMDVQASVPDMLPTDFAALAYCDDNSTTPPTRYEADKFSFTADGNLVYPVDMESGDLYYYPAPNFTKVTDPVPLHVSLHSTLIYFFYAQYYYQSGEGDLEEQRIADTYLARFNKNKEMKINTLKKQEPDDQPVKTTDVMPKRSNGRIARSGYYE